MYETEAEAGKFFSCLNDLRNCSTDQLIEQLNILFCCIGKLDADDTLAAYQTLETTRNILYTKQVASAEEIMILKSIERAIQQHMTALSEKYPDDKYLEKKRRFVYRSFSRDII